MPNHAESEVVIIGAGLAGLRCAQVLNNCGRSVTLLEKNDFVGGRLRSFVQDGYVMDEGFQLINPSYPALQRSGVLDDFDLRIFDSEIRFIGQPRSFVLADPRKAPWRALKGIANSPLRLADLLALARITGRARFTPGQQILDQVDQPTRKAFEQAGVSPQSIDKVLTPFLRGTFLDDQLETSWNYALLVLKSFTRASPGTHPEGIQALATAFLEKASSTTIHLGVEVQRIQQGRVLSDGGEFSARELVMAASPSLVGEETVRWRPQTTWWWSLPKLSDSGALRISQEDPLLTSALDLSSRAPERSPLGRSLVATPMNSKSPNLELERRARRIVSRLYDVYESDVELIDTTVVERALPTTNSPLRTRSGEICNGVILAGDYLETPSIQGALVSGSKAAHAVLRRISKGEGSST